MPSTTSAPAAPSPVTRQHSTTSETPLWWLFRLAVAMCYIGHGAFGIITKADWLPFFALVGLGPDTAYRLMPLVGALDIALGISALVSPRRFVLLHMVIWSVWTAALRPLTGQSVFETLERAGNYGVPLAMLIMAGTRVPLREWFTEVGPCALTPGRRRLMQRVLILTTSVLLIGHGGLAAIEQKAMVALHAESIGLSAAAAVRAGWLEIAMGLAVLRWQPAALLLSIAVWKIGTELLFPLSGAPWWEFIERGGSYAAPLALVLLAMATRRERVAAAAPHARSDGGTRLLSRTGLPLLLCPLMAIATLPAPLTAQRHVGDAELITRLVRGGNTLVCRHTATDHSAPDGGRTRDGQRNLTAEGEEQARRIAAAIRTLGLRIGVIRSNPMYRNVETAQLAFGTPRVDSTLAGAPAADSIRVALRRRPAPGTNDVIMTRIGILLRVFPRAEVGAIEEGDCIVVAAGANGGYEVLRRLSVTDWERLATLDGRRAGQTRSR